MIECATVKDVMSCNEIPVDPSKGKNEAEQEEQMIRPVEDVCEP